MWVASALRKNAFKRRFETQGHKTWKNAVTVTDFLVLFLFGFGWNTSLSSCEVITGRTTVVCLDTQ